MHIKAERTTLEEEKRRKDKIGRCYILHSLFIRLGVQILLNAGEKYIASEKWMGDWEVILNFVFFAVTD